VSFIQLQGVTRTYGRGPAAVTPLADVTLTIEQGEFFVLLGPSGSGKTTLLNLIAGIDRPDAGSVSVAGTDLSSLGSGALADWRSEHVGYVFQSPNLVPVLSAYENVELPLWLFRMSRAERHKRVETALRAVGLLERALHRPKALSGGQEQRVAIARAIVADPQVIVADEPTGNLDHVAAEGVLDLLRRLNRERGKTVVMVTHDPRAAAFGTRSLYLDKGSLGDAPGALALALAPEVRP
jgi:putative ABC transport system ATP-binding protein